MPKSSDGKNLRQYLLAALIILLVAMTGFYYTAQRGLHGDDDNLWLYFYSFKVSQNSKVTPIENEVIGFAKENNADPTSLMRLEMRRDYGWNYSIPMFIWNRLQNVFPKPSSSEQFPAYLASLLPLMFAVSTGIAWLALLFSLYRIPDEGLLLSVTFSLSLMAALLLLSNPPASMILLDFSSFKRGWQNFLNYILNPGPGMSFFGFTPRNNIMILALAVFIVRWRQMHLLSYALLLPLYGYHSSMTLLLTVHLLGIDILTNRDKLRHPLCFSIIVTGFIYGLWRETLWKDIGHPGVIALLLATLVISLLSLIFLPNPFLRFAPVKNFIGYLQRNIQSMGSPFIESLLLIGFWLLSLPLVFFIASHMTHNQNYYFWHQVHGRSIALLLAVVVTGLVYAILPRIKYPIVITMTLVLVWAGGFALSVSKHPSLYALLLKETSWSQEFITGKRKLEDYPFRPFPGYIVSEAAIYYAMGEMLALGTDRLGDIKTTADIR